MRRECNGNNNNNIIGGRNYRYDNAYRAIHNTTRIQYTYRRLCICVCIYYIV